MFFQSRVSWQKQRINLAIAVRASNDTAEQDCEVKGRCPLPFLYLQFPPALLFELVDDGTYGKVFSFAFTSSCAHCRCSRLLTRSPVLDSPPCPLKKGVSEPIQCGPTAVIIRKVPAARRSVQSRSLDGLGDW